MIAAWIMVGLGAFMVSSAIIPYYFWVWPSREKPRTILGILSAILYAVLGIYLFFAGWNLSVYLES